MKLKLPIYLWIIILSIEPYALVAGERSAPERLALGSISKDGTSIEVETERCTVKSPYSIICLNIGRVCEAARAKQKKQDDYYFGCALDNWKKSHPSESCIEVPYHSPSECWPMSFGGFR